MRKIIKLVFFLLTFTLKVILPAHYDDNNVKWTNHNNYISYALVQKNGKLMARIKLNKHLNLEDWNKLIINLKTSTKTNHPFKWNFK